MSSKYDGAFNYHMAVSYTHLDVYKRQLVFLPAVSSFFIPKLLGGGQYFLIGNLIENQFITVGEWNFGSAISMIMAVIMMLLMMLVRKVEIRNQGGKEE